MPPVIAAGVTAAGITGTVAGISIASLIGEGVTLGGIFAIGLLTRPAGKAKTAGEMVTTRQPLPPRVRAYGRVKIGGAIYFQTAPWWLMKGIYLCEGPIDAVEQIWLGDYLTIHTEFNDLSYAGIWPWRDQINFFVQKGTIPQDVNPSILINNSWWDASHSGHGLANIAMKCDIPWNPKDNFQKYYPNGIPPLRAVIRGEIVYDPRDAVPKYSENPSLIILDFLTSSRGFNIPNSRINFASFSSFANLCDTTVVRFDGQLEPKYRCWGTYELTEEPRAVLQRLLLTCDGEIVQLGDGTIAIRGGQFVTPTVTIPASMILGYEVQSGPDKLSGFNQYIVHYTEPIQDFQLVQGPNYDDISAQAASGGQIISQNLELAMVPSVWQAIRLAKIYMAQNNPRRQLVIRARLAALDALSERIINVVIDELGINDTFWIKKFDISGDLQSCTISLSSIRADDYDITSTGGGIPGPGPISPPVSVAITSDLMVTHTGAPQLQAAVLAPTDTTLELRAQTSADGGNTWTYMTANGSFSAASVGLVSGAVYQVRAAFRRITGFGTGPDGPFTLPVEVLLDAEAYDAVTASIAARTPQDYGLASAAVTSRDDWTLGKADYGLVSAAVTSSQDHGLVSAAVTSSKDFELDPSAAANASLDLGFGSG